MSNIKNINNKILNCYKCKIAPNRGVGFGNIKSNIMFIAQNPGWQPEIKSKDIIPFALNTEKGKASGYWFRKLLNKCKLTNDDFYITNVIKCPTNKNRCPKEKEVENCFEHLQREIKLQVPKLIVLLGNSAKELFENKKNEISKNIKIIYIYHPGFIRYNPHLFKRWAGNFKKQFKEFNNERN